MSVALMIITKASVKFPVQVRCVRQGARGWCTGMTQRDGMGREAGGGFRMGIFGSSVVKNLPANAGDTDLIPDQ